MGGEIFILAISVIALALFFDFSNGFNDSGSIVATMVSTGALSPRGALLSAAIFEFIGAFFLGTGVARTIGKGIVDPGRINLSVVLAALCAALSWNFIVWYFGIPSSSSHALIGGILGAILISSGSAVINWKIVLWIITILIATPLIGLIAGYAFTRIILDFFSNVKPSRANSVFKRLQVISSIGLALSHGTNDAQKTMGIITMMLITLYKISPQSMKIFYSPNPKKSFFIPTWVVLSCAISIAIGIGTGGWRIIKTLGAKLYKIRPVHGFCAQSCSGMIIYISALLGFPVSTTQITSSSIMGAGSAQRVNAVRWGIVENIIMTWIITIPVSALIGGLIYSGIHFFRPFWE